MNNWYIACIVIRDCVTEIIQEYNVSYIYIYILLSLTKHLEYYIFIVCFLANLSGKFILQMLI